MLLANETVAQHLADHGDADAVPHPRGAGLAQGREFEEFISSLGHTPRRAVAQRAAEALPEAGQGDRGHAGRARHRHADAADDAEGALRRRQPRALRPGGEELLPLHLADPPLSRPRRASLAARAAPRPAHRGAACASGRRSCRKRRATPPTASAAPTRPSASSCSGRRSGSWPTRSATSSRATSSASRRSACSSQLIEHFVDGPGPHLEHGRRLLPLRRPAARAVRREHREELPAGRQGRGAGHASGHGAPAGGAGARRHPGRRAAVRAQPGTPEEHGGVEGGDEEAGLPARAPGAGAGAAAEAAALSRPWRAEAASTDAAEAARRPFLPSRPS